MEKLQAFRDKRLIKVVTGIRRCGKSTLLQMFQRSLLEDGVAPQQIVSVNFEDMDVVHLLEADTLHRHLQERMVPGQMTYVFLDEVQMVADFQRVVDSLQLSPLADIYITGSNARMLSGELATLLSGRYVEIEMLPLSFKEMVDHLGDRAELQRKYASYLAWSAFPYALELRHDPALVRDYLQGIFNTILLKDVVARLRVADVMMLESLIRFLFDNIGSVISTKKISDTMTSSGRRISTHTVESYIKGLRDSFIVYQARRYDIKGKQYLKTLEKYYAVDMGLRAFALGRRGGDVSHVLENVVYLELLRRGYDVYVGKIDDNEVDFVAMDGKGMRYFQVAASAREPATLERELKPLRKIGDDYPKTLLTLDEDPEGDIDGIRILNVLNFLLEA